MHTSSWSLNFCLEHLLPSRVSVCTCVLAHMCRCSWILKGPFLFVCFVVLKELIASHHKNCRTENQIKTLILILSFLWLWNSERVWAILEAPVTFWSRCRLAYLLQCRAVGNQPWEARYATPALRKLHCFVALMPIACPFNSRKQYFRLGDVGVGGYGRSEPVQ